MPVDHELINTTLASIKADPQTIELLRDLHTKALTEPPFNSVGPESLSAALDRFVALDPDKCALVYLLLRASGARFVVEAGTSFGLSTIYLALAVSQNAAAQGLTGANGKVIATENEPSKAEQARKYWKAAGDDLDKWIELREGDLRETLKSDLPEQIDFLLLDSKCFILCLKGLLTVPCSLDSSRAACAARGAASPQGWRHDCRGQLCC